MTTEELGRPEDTSEGSNTNEGIDDSAWQVLLSKILRGEMTDPFRTYPESNVHGIDLLIKYCMYSQDHLNVPTLLKHVTVIRSFQGCLSSFPWSPPSDTNTNTTYYVPLIWTDRVLFHAILQLSSFHLEKTQKYGSYTTSHQLMGEWVRLLRVRIEDSDLEDGVSDQTLSAVATLAAIEHEKGNLKMLRMHMEGLKRMIQVRGGFQALRESNAMVANATFWMFVAAMYEVPFPNLDPVLPPFFPGNCNLAMSPSVGRISHFEDVAENFEAPLPHVSQLVPTDAAYPTANTSLVILTRMCTLFSHLLSLPAMIAYDSSGLAVASDTSALITECTRYAILLHIFSPWRGLPPDGTLTINLLLHRLMSSLKTILSSLQFKNGLIMWILAIGGVAALNTPERSWFVAHLADTTEELQIQTWDQMKLRLSRVIWHEILCSRPHEKLWQEVLGKRLRHKEEI